MSETRAAQAWAICAGRRTFEIPALQQQLALPHSKGTPAIFYPQTQLQSDHQFLAQLSCGAEFDSVAFPCRCSNKVWVTDITYIRTEEGWLYLAIAKDLFGRRIVGRATGNRINTDLCKRALSAAIRRYRPDAGLIHHSDQGVQYASRDYQRLLQ